jgi:hypothetical protein
MVKDASAGCWSFAAAPLSRGSGQEAIDIGEHGRLLGDREDMAASVAGPIERQLSTIAGITSMTSLSALLLSRCTLVRF